MLHTFSVGYFATAQYDVFFVPYRRHCRNEVVKLPLVNLFESFGRIAHFLVDNRLISHFRRVITVLLHYRKHRKLILGGFKHIRFYFAPYVLADRFGISRGIEFNELLFAR